MSFNITLWKVDGNKLGEIQKSKLDSENRLEDWIYQDSSILGMDVLIIGRQVPTDYGGRIDLLGIDSQGDLVIIELKRDKAPREAVAQILDYASWVKNLAYEEIDNITAKRFGKSLSEGFSEFFGIALPEKVNTNHKMVIVASELDDSSERIVQYLAEKININAVFFTFFKTETEELIGRAWLRDPEEPPTDSEWSGFWFFNIGEEGGYRNWDDCWTYGYIGAGQGKRYRNTMQNLEIGDKIFAYLGGKGYVGYGEVVKEAQMIKDFVVESKQKRLLELELNAPNAGTNIDDPDMSEWVAGVKWMEKFDRDHAKTFKGIFVFPAVRCKLKNKATVDFLKREFNVRD